MLELFEKYKANPDKLQTYGFKESDGAYHFSQKIMKGDFRLEVTIRDGELDYQIFDCDTDDVYLQVKMEQVTGVRFVKLVRQLFWLSVRTVLTRLAFSMSRVSDYGIMRLRFIRGK